MVEELKQKFEFKSKTLEDKFKVAQQTKNELMRQIEQVNENVRMLKMIKNDNEAFESLRNLEGQIAKIYKNDINQDLRKDITGIEMLKEMERKLEQQIREIKHYRSGWPDLVFEKEKNCIKQKKDQMKELK